MNKAENSLSYAEDPMVVHPPHYNQGSIECIDALQSMLGHAGFVAFLRGQVVKYLWRGLHKQDTIQDCQKAAWYLARLNQVLAAVELEKKTDPRRAEDQITQSGTLPDTQMDALTQKYLDGAKKRFTD